jgi:hydrogenase maturation protease
VVVGVGNTILSDDGVGVHAARLLQHDPRVPAGVTILDGGTLGLELLPYVSDASRVLFLDAVNSGAKCPEHSPG